MRVRVDKVVREVVDVRVEEGCRSPWQTYCLLESAMPADPSPKKSTPPEYTQEKENCASTTGTPESSSMLLAASPKHAVSSETSS